MSQATELLDSLVEEDITDYSSTESHIVVNADRTITVPDELKSIAVQYDNNVETVTFDCPRYWDEHDFSTMNIYINYMRSDGHRGQYHAKNVSIDDSDKSMIHFEWTVSNDATLSSGKLSFLVCIKNLETDIQPHWNSRLNQDLTVAPGMELYDQEAEQSPDVIEMMLVRLDNLERANAIVLIDQNTGIDYKLYVVNSKLMITESEG